MPVAVVVTVAARGFGAVAGRSRSVGSAIADSTDQKVSPSSCNCWGNTSIASLHNSEFLQFVQICFDLEGI